MSEQELELCARKARAFDWLEQNPEAGEPFIVYHPPSDIITWMIGKSGEEYDSLLEAVEATYATQNGERG